jgi:hypothetical protein
MDLARALATDPRVKWIIGRVTALSGDTFTMTYRGGVVQGVAALDSYTPKVGDVVHVLASDQSGMIAIGSNNQPAAIPSSPVSVMPVSFASSAVATYEISAGSWTSGVLQASPDSLALWLYPMPIGGPGMSGPMARFTIQIAAEPTIPLEFILHAASAATGTPEILDMSYSVAASPVGGATDVALPLDWATELLQGRAQGIGVGGGDYTVTLTGSSGLLTFTPLL